MCAKLKGFVPLRRLGAFLSALSLCFALTVPALADGTVLSGSASFQGGGYNGSSWSSGWYSSVSSGASDKSLYTSARGAGFNRAVLSSSLVPSSADIGIYLSFYYKSSVGATQNKVPSASDFSVRYVSADTGAEVLKPISSLSLFSPAGQSSSESYSDGVSIVARLSNSVSSPIDTSSVWLFSGPSTSSYQPNWYLSSVSSASGYFYQYITSFRVVSTSSSAELDALESMA